jgi:hypothetical protein
MKPPVDKNGLKEAAVQTEKAERVFDEIEGK